MLISFDEAIAALSLPPPTPHGNAFFAIQCISENYRVIGVKIYILERARNPSNEAVAHPSLQRCDLIIQGGHLFSNHDFQQSFWLGKHSAESLAQAGFCLQGLRYKECSQTDLDKACLYRAEYAISQLHGWQGETPVKPSMLTPEWLALLAEHLQPDHPIHNTSVFSQVDGPLPDREKSEKYADCIQKLLDCVLDNPW